MKGEDNGKHCGTCIFAPPIPGIGLPSFSDQMPEADARALTNYLYQLNEQLTYVLTNLSSENMSEDYLSGKES